MFDVLKDPESTGKFRIRCPEEPAEMRGNKWILRMVLSPYFRIKEDAGLWGWIWATIGTFGAWIFADPFRFAIALWITSTFMDFVAGVAAARSPRTRKKYDPAIARAGLIGKMVSVGLLFLLRWFEEWVTIHARDTFHLPDSGGRVAAFFAVLLFTVDLQSIARHVETLTGRPLPFIAQFTGLIQRVIGSKFPSPPPVSDLELPPPETGVTGGDLPSAPDQRRALKGGRG